MVQGNVSRTMVRNRFYTRDTESGRPSNWPVLIKKRIVLEQMASRRKSDGGVDGNRWYWSSVAVHCFINGGGR